MPEEDNQRRAKSSPKPDEQGNAFEQDIGDHLNRSGTIDKIPPWAALIFSLSSGILIIIVGSIFFSDPTSQRLFACAGLGSILALLGAKAVFRHKGIIIVGSGAVAVVLYLVGAWYPISRNICHLQVRVLNLESNYETPELSVASSIPIAYDPETGNSTLSLDIEQLFGDLELRFAYNNTRRLDLPQIAREYVIEAVDNCQNTTWYYAPENRGVWNQDRVRINREIVSTHLFSPFSTTVYRQQHYSIFRLAYADLESTSEVDGRLSVEQISLIRSDNISDRIHFLDDFDYRNISALPQIVDLISDESSSVSTQEFAIQIAHRIFINQQDDPTRLLAMFDAETFLALGAPLSTEELSQQELLSMISFLITSLNENEMRNLFSSDSSMDNIDSILSIVEEIFLFVPENVKEQVLRALNDVVEGSDLDSEILQRIEELRDRYAWQSQWERFQIWYFQKVEDPILIRRFLENFGNGAVSIQPPRGPVQLRETPTNIVWCGSNTPTPLLQALLRGLLRSGADVRLVSRYEDGPSFRPNTIQIGTLVPPGWVRPVLANGNEAPRGILYDSESVSAEELRSRFSITVETPTYDLNGLHPINADSIDALPDNACG